MEQIKDVVCTVCWVLREGCGVFFQAEDGIRDVERSRGLGDVYKRQVRAHPVVLALSLIHI